MRERVLVLSSKFESLIGEIRNVPNWNAARYLDQIWLKGPMDNGKYQVLLLSLPVILSYEVDERQRLFKMGDMTPTSMLQVMDWLDLRDFSPIKLPVSALPASLEHQLQVHLVRSGSEKPVCLLQTSLSLWKSYVDGAPLVRLQQLRFAVSSEKEVLIMGNPLPPIPGRGYWNYGHLLVPIGFDFDPPLLADLLVQRLTKETKSFILFNEKGHYMYVAEEAFIEAERALVRQIF